jgi:hypothetical protein
MLQICLVFGKFFYQNIYYAQNEYDIQNQRKKLNRLTYVLLENKIFRNLTPWAKFLEKELGKYS